MEVKANTKSRVRQVTSETCVKFYPATRRHMQWDRNVQNHRCENWAQIIRFISLDWFKMEEFSAWDCTPQIRIRSGGMAPRFLNIYTKLSWVLSLKFRQLRIRYSFPDPETVTMLGFLLILSTAVTACCTCFKIKYLSVLSTEYIYVFCAILLMNNQQ
jgi:hypothetical protein